MKSYYRSQLFFLRLITGKRHEEVLSKATNLSGPVFSFQPELIDIPSNLLRRVYDERPELRFTEENSTLGGATKAAGSKSTGAVRRLAVSAGASHALKHLATFHGRCARRRGGPLRRRRRAEGVAVRLERGGVGAEEYKHAVVAF